MCVSNETGGGENKAKLEQTLWRSRMKWNLQLADDSGEFPFIRPGNPHLLSELQESVGQFDTLIVGAAAGEQGVEMSDSQRASGTEFRSRDHSAEELRCRSSPASQRVA